MIILTDFKEVSNIDKQGIYDKVLVVQSLFLGELPMFTILISISASRLYGTFSSIEEAVKFLEEKGWVKKQFSDNIGVDKTGYNYPWRKKRKLAYIVPIRPKEDF